MAQLSFPTSALLAAFPFKPRHISFDVYDIEAQKQYVVIAAATGLSALSELTPTSTAPAAHNTSHQSGGSDPIKLDDLAAPDDNTDLNASTTKHGLLKKLSNDTATFLRGDGSWSSPGVGGLQVWYPDAPPTSPETENDEFDAGTLDAKWTDWDHSSSMTTSIDTTRKMLKLVQTGNGNVRFGGVYQAVPDTEFAVYSKCHVVHQSGATGLGAGLMVGDDLSNTASDFRTCENAFSSSGATFNMIARTWSAYNGTASASTARAIQTGYMRMRVNGTTVISDYSIDGVQWTQIVSVTVGFTPVHFGLCFTQVDNAAEATAYFDFVRVFSGAGTSGYNATSIGRFL